MNEKEVSKPIIIEHEMIKANEDRGTKKDRKLFVENIGWLLSQTRLGVVSTELDDNERVVVTFDNGYTRKINVECDSYGAIVLDVIKRLV